MDDKNLYSLQKKFQKNITSDASELNFISRNNNAYERFDIYKKSIINTLKDILEKKYPSLYDFTLYDFF